MPNFQGSQTSKEPHRKSLNHEPKMADNIVCPFLFLASKPPEGGSHDCINSHQTRPLSFWLDEPHFRNYWNLPSIVTHHAVCSALGLLFFQELPTAPSLVAQSATAWSHDQKLGAARQYQSKRKNHGYRFLGRHAWNFLFDPQPFAHNKGDSHLYWHWRLRIYLDSPITTTPS